MNAAFKDLLRVLEYSFKNEGFSATVVSEKSPAVADRVLAELAKADDPHAAVLRCPDAGWSLAANLNAYEVLRHGRLIFTVSGMAALVKSVKSVRRPSEEHSS